jgi:hypothetical protein
MLAGQPGCSKSTCGLSCPGVEQHVFGSSEEFTAINFSNRKDILPPIKWDWMEFLTPEEKAKLFDEKTSDIDADNLKVLATARKIKKYRRYIMQLKSDLMEGKRPELKTAFLDNGTSFFSEFEDYVNVVHRSKFITSGGEYNSIKFSMVYFDEVMAFLELFNSLPCHTVMSFHVEMTVDQETSAKVDFMNDAKNKVKHAKEFNPMIMGKVKYALTGKFDFAFFLFTEENPGQPNKYIAKLEADTTNVGMAKGRIQPFDAGRRIELPKGTFFDFLDGAVKKKIAGNQAGK